MARAPGPKVYIHKHTWNHDARSLRASLSQRARPMLAPSHTHSLLRPFHKRRVRTYIFSFSQRRTLAWLPFYRTLHFRCAFISRTQNSGADRPTALRRCLWPAVVFLLSHTPSTLHTYIQEGSARTYSQRQLLVISCVVYVDAFYIFCMAWRAQ